MPQSINLPLFLALATTSHRTFRHVISYFVFRHQCTSLAPLATQTMIKICSTSSPQKFKTKLNSMFVYRFICMTQQGTDLL